MMGISLRAAVLIGLVSGVGGGLGFRASGAMAEPIALTGWNADVVFENAATTVATSFDRPGQRPADYALYAWFEAGLEGHTDGLPSARKLVGAADAKVAFELQPYTTNNVLLLSGTNAAGKLALVEPTVCRGLYLLASAGNGDAAVTLQLHFSDGSDSQPIAIQVPDWFTGAESKLTRTVAVSGLGRSNGQEGFSYEEHGDDAFGLYQIKVDLAGPGLDKKTIQSIAFKKGSGGGTAGIFAVSGERGGAKSEK